MARLLCTGDLHLGSGTRYGRTPTERLEEQETLWHSIMDVARLHEVDAILFAGDAFEGPLPTPEQYRAFLGGIASAPCPVLAIVGNGRHDSAMRDTSALHVLSDPKLTVHSRPGTWRVPGSDVTVATLPWTPISRLVAAQNGGSREAIYQEAADLLLRTAADLRARIDGPAVLLLHWSISGASLPNGLGVEHLREVVLPLADLEALGYEHIVAGHIHAPQVLGSAFYVGSPMPLNFGETGEHGVWLLNTETAPLFVPLDSRPFVTIEGSVADETFHLWEEVEGAYVKLRVHGTASELRGYDLAGLRAAVLEEGRAHHVLVETLPEQENRARVEGLDATITAEDALRLWLAAQGIEREQAERLREMHGVYVDAVA